VKSISPLVAVVDDDESIRKALKNLFLSAEINAAFYTSGADFFNGIAERKPDCVVLDLHMPEMDGFEVQSRLARDDIRVPVIIITGHDSSDVRSRAMAGRPSAYFRKPVDGRALLDTIEFVTAQPPARRNTPRIAF
jgi:FixJ family two-component response regulator